MTREVVCKFPPFVNVDITGRVRVGGTLGGSHIVMGGDRWFPRATILGERVCLLLPPIITCWSRRQVAYIVMHCGVDSVRDGRSCTFFRIVFPVCSVLVRRCGVAFNALSCSGKFRQCRCGNFGVVSRRRPAGHRFQMFPRLRCGVAHHHVLSRQPCHLQCHLYFRPPAETKV